LCRTKISINGMVGMGYARAPGGKLQKTVA
jgi:hypothetical protein